MAKGKHIEINEEVIRKKMARYSLLVGKEISQLVRNGARLQCVELAKFTWPQEKAHGESRIGTDVSKIFTALNPKWWRAATKKGELSTADGRPLVSPGQKMIADLPSAKSFHKANRVFRLGKELTQDEKAAVKLSVRKALVKDLQKKVGLCKAGWAVAASLCKADVRQPMRGIPQWVTRNMAKAVGNVREKNLTGMGFKVDLTNRINYTDELLTKKYQAIARNIARGSFVKMMSAAIRATKLKEAGLK
jgi:hypothetical protein